MNIVCLGPPIAETGSSRSIAEMNRRGAVLFVHSCRQRHLLTLHHRYNYERVGRHLARDATFVLHMIAKRSPTVTAIKFIVPHLGVRSRC